MSRGYRPIIRHGLKRGLPSRAGFSRREVLKRAAGGAAAAALAPVIGALGLGCRTHHAPPPVPSRYGWIAAGMRVAVVGAGFAGLACADTLRRWRAEVRVFEASNRPGGRVLTDRRIVAGRNVELGAEFIGENHPTVVRFARDYGLRLVEVEEAQGDDAIILDGRLVTGEEADALYEQIDALLADLIELARPIDPVRPYASGDAGRLDRTSFADYLAGRNLPAEVRRLIDALEAADNGVPTERMSLLAMLAMIAGGGFEQYYEISETHRLADGNDRLAVAIARPLNDRLSYGDPVVSIVRRESEAVVTTDSGESFTCDAVVLATPPAAWEKIEFDPPLDPGLRPQMGSNVKLILRVTEPVWRERGLKPELAGDGLVNLTWESARRNRQGQSGFTMFSGAESSQAMRRLGSEERLEQALSAVAPAYPRLSEVIDQSRFVDWPGMPRLRGSYSFPAPGEVTQFGPVLVDGVQDDLAPLRFAGEHTSYGFIGYMEGALSSGVRAAQGLIQRHRATLYQAAGRD